MRFYKNFVFNQSFKVIWFILVLAAGRLASPNEKEEQWQEDLERELQQKREEQRSAMLAR